MKVIYVCTKCSIAKLYLLKMKYIGKYILVLVNTISLYLLALINYYSKSSKILNTFLFLFLYKMFVIRTGIHKMPVPIANSEDFRSSLIRVCPACLGFFGRQLVFKILAHLP